MLAPRVLAPMSVGAPIRLTPRQLLAIMIGLGWWVMSMAQAQALALALACAMLKSPS
jgi:hypothetical protein